MSETGRRGGSSKRAWLVAWLGGPLIGIANGVVREATYGRRLEEQAAHQVSSLIGIAAFAAYFSLLERRWPIDSGGEALRIGGAWLILTVGFEFVFGRLVAKRSWRELAADYDLTRGRTWPLMLAWIAAGPAAVRRLLSPPA